MYIYRIVLVKIAKLLDQQTQILQIEHVSLNYLPFLKNMNKNKLTFLVHSINYLKTKFNEK